MTAARALEPIETADDRELVAAARADPAAFLELYERYFERVLGYARVSLRDTAASEDVTSEVFLTALGRLDSYRGDGSFAAWLFGIARNAVRDAHRARRTATAKGALLAVMANAVPRPEEDILAAERTVDLAGALALLGADERQLLALRYGASLSYSEISAIVGSNPGAIRVRVHRILALLRRRYHDEDRGFHPARTRPGRARTTPASR
jgi:RNA polymerase sigma-70 factor (ECF subfamily)